MGLVFTKHRGKLLKGHGKEANERGMENYNEVNR
jgi:hypothetical protein